jgi:hypothetical protein
MDRYQPLRVLSQLSSVLSQLSLVLLCGLAAEGCGIEVTPTTPTTSTGPLTAATSTESFSGTLAAAGTTLNTFTVASAGSVQISLTSVAPLATLALGVSIGGWNGVSCTLIAKNEAARSGSIALTGTAASGTYCVNVYDVGNIASDVSFDFTVTVTHP